MIRRVLPAVVTLVVLAALLLSRPGASPARLAAPGAAWLQASPAGSPVATPAGQIGANLPAGISLDLLASAALERPVPTRSRLRLERISFAPDTDLAGRPTGVELLAVEEGTLVVEGGDQPRTLTAGGQLLLTPPAPYRLRAEGGSAVVLRLSVSAPDGRGTPAAEGTPSGRAQAEEATPATASASPAVATSATLLLEGEIARLTARRGTLFIARASFAPGVISGQQYFAGPIGLIVETGSITVEGEDGVPLTLEAGHGLIVPPYALHRVGNGEAAAAVALVVGVLPEAQGGAIAPEPTPTPEPDVLRTVAAGATSVANAAAALATREADAGRTAVALSTQLAETTADLATAETRAADAEAAQSTAEARFAAAAVTIEAAGTAQAATDADLATAAAALAAAQTARAETDATVAALQTAGADLAATATAAADTAATASADLEATLTAQQTAAAEGAAALEATIAGQDERAANLAAAATAADAAAAAALATAEADAAARLATAEGQAAQAAATVAALGTSVGAGEAAQATAAADLANAEATIAALATRAAETAQVAVASLNPEYVELVIQVDAAGVLGGDQPTRRAARNELRRALQPFVDAECRAGVVLTFGHGASIDIGSRLAAAVNAIARDIAPTIFEGAAFDAFGNLNPPPGQVDIRIYFFTGCPPAEA